MARKRLVSKETTLERSKVRLVEPSAEELAGMTRRQLERAAADGRTKTYRVTWRVGVNGGRSVQLHFQKRYGIAERDEACVDDMLAEARARQRQRLDRELGLWKDATPESLLSDYLLGKAMADVDSHVGEDRGKDEIRQSTADDVKRNFRLFAAFCGNVRICDVDDPAVMEQLLERYAKLHGRASAIHMKSNLSKYAFDRLRRRRVMSCDPCAGKMDLPNVKKGTGRIVHGVSLGEDVRQAFVAWLREQDAKVADIPSWGRYGAKERQAVRQVAIDVALAQATCAFRVSELRLMTCSQVTVDERGAVWVEVTAERSKTHRGRRFPVWDEGCAAMLKGRVETRDEDGNVVRRGDDEPVFPTTRGTFWDDGDLACRERKLYDQAADELGIDGLHHVAGHSWRTCVATHLNQLGVPMGSVAAILGHDAVTEARYYIDEDDAETAVGELKKAFGLDVAEPRGEGNVISYEEAMRARKARKARSRQGTA